MSSCVVQAPRRTDELSDWVPGGKTFYLLAFSLRSNRVYCLPCVEPNFQNRGSWQLGEMFVFR